MAKERKMYFYPAVFYPENHGGFTVVFPDFEYIATQGKDMDEAYEKANEVLGIGIEDALTGEIKLPKPSQVENISFDLEIGDIEKATIVIIGVDMSEWLLKFSMKTVRRNITLPESLDLALRKKKVNVSRICQKALMEEVNLNNF